MVIQGTSYPSDFEAKKTMIAAASKLEAKGWMVAGDGSLSVRVGPNAIWITVDGADKYALTQDQMVRIDLNGKQMATNKPKPLGSDLDAHLKIYKENDSVQAVIHAYPVCSVVLGARGQGIEAAGFAPSVRKLGRIQLTRSSDPKAASDEIALLCKTDKGAIIPNDGCFMWGRSVSDAVSCMEALDFYCKAFKCLGRTGSGCSSCTTHCSGVSCNGNCENCAQADSCPSCRKPQINVSGSFEPQLVRMDPVPAAQPVPAPQPVSVSALPSGMTGLIRPGTALPPLPEADVKPQAPAAPVQPAVPERQPAAEKPDLVIHTPKSLVISEVVRRSINR